MTYSLQYQMAFLWNFGDDGWKNSIERNYKITNKKLLDWYEIIPSGVFLLIAKLHYDLSFFLLTRRTPTIAEISIMLGQIIIFV